MRLEEHEETAGSLEKETLISTCTFWIGWCDAFLKQQFSEINFSTIVVLQEKSIDSRITIIEHTSNSRMSVFSYILTKQ